MTGVDLDEVVVRHSGSIRIGPLSQHVPPGGLLCLIGPNGAGKTSLLHAIAGLCRHGGRIRVGDQVLEGLSPRRRGRLVALVAQRPAIPEDMTVMDYVLLGRTPHIATFALESSHDRAVAWATLERLDLTAFSERPLVRLSGGELQRVLLARALTQEAPVLLLDEPTSALDLGHQQQVLQLVDELRRDLGLAVVTTMHDLTLAGSHADRLVLLNEGTVVAEGPPSAVLTEPTLRRYYQADIEVLRARDGTIAVVPLSAAAAAASSRWDLPSGRTR